MKNKKTRIIIIIIIIKRSPWWTVTLKDTWAQKTALNHGHSRSAVHFFSKIQNYILKQTKPHVTCVQSQCANVSQNSRLPVPPTSFYYDYYFIMKLLLWLSLFPVSSCFFLNIFLAYFILPCEKNSNLSCCGERTANFYVDFMVTICTILKVLILVYIRISVFRHVRNCYSITLIFYEHCTVALLCASIYEAEKLWNKCSFYKINKMVLITCVTL